MTSGFSIDVSMVRSPNRVLTPIGTFFENPDVIFCSSFRNRRLGGLKLMMLPKTVRDCIKMIKLLKPVGDSSKLAFLFYQPEMI
jgi:hypothetical protein